jgi:hypothetical protein
MWDLCDLSYQALIESLDMQMVSERQRNESSSTPGGNAAAADMYMPPPSYEDVKSNGGSQNASEAAPVSKAAQKALYFLAEVASSTSQACVYSCSVEDALCFMVMLLGGIGVLVSLLYSQVVQYTE